MTGSHHKLLPIEARRKIAEDCLNGRSSRRERYAEEIIAGDLFLLNGMVRSYWHLLATEQPAQRPGRRGQWKAEEHDGDWLWVWQDWGPGR